MTPPSAFVTQPLDIAQGQRPQLSALSQSSTNAGAVGSDTVRLGHQNQRWSGCAPPAHIGCVSLQPLPDKRLLEDGSLTLAC